MSTYLVAFMVTTNFKIRGDSTYAVITHADVYDYTQFSYVAGEKIIDAYGSLFNRTYEELGNPLMQMAGSPKFPHNGMENWGLTIYR